MGPKQIPVEQRVYFPVWYKIRQTDKVQYNEMMCETN